MEAASGEPFVDAEIRGVPYGVREEPQVNPDSESGQIPRPSETRSDRDIRRIPTKAGMMKEARVAPKVSAKPIICVARTRKRTLSFVAQISTMQSRAPNC